MKPKKVEQSRLTLLGVEVDKKELNKKLFSNFAYDARLDKVSKEEITKEDIASELMKDESFLDELLTEFSS